MSTRLQTTIIIGAGEHLIRFLNLSGDELLLEPVTVAYAEGIDATTTALDGVDAARPLQGSSLSETVSLLVLLDRSEWLTETVSPLESAQAGNAIPLSLAEEQSADDAVGSDVTNLPDAEVEEAITLSDATEAVQTVPVGPLEEMVAAQERLASAIRVRSRTKRIFFRWGD